MAKQTKAVASRIKEATGVDVSKCYQCGKCTAGCVLGDDMDISSSMVMRMLQTGTEQNYDKVLRSNAIWLCVNCQNCIGRCPKEVDIPKVMDFLRAESLKRGCVSKQAKPILSFYKSFIDVLRYTGRLSEVFMTIGFKLRTFRLFQDMQKVPSMLWRGKLKFIPEKIKDMKSIKHIFQSTKNK